MLKNILLDLDGTLVNTNNEIFDKAFFKCIGKKLYQDGYDGEKVAKAVLGGVQKMLLNDGSKSNEDVFWEFFEKTTNIKKNEIIETFDSFYDNNYDELRCYVMVEEVANDAVKILKSKGYNLVIATNPIFPIQAINKRATWGNIDLNDFSYVTAYDNSSYSKPNIGYYKEILEKNNFKAEETMMFGNDMVTDFVIEQIGVPCYIITDNLLNEEKIDECKQKGTYNEFLEFVKKLPDINKKI